MKKGLAPGPPYPIPLGPNPLGPPGPGIKGTGGPLGYLQRQKNDNNTVIMLIRSLNLQECYTYASLAIGSFLPPTVRVPLRSSSFFCLLEGLTSTINSGFTFFLYCSRCLRPFMCISLAFGSLKRHSHNLQLKDMTFPNKT
jgi:hypothetical protein